MSEEIDSELRDIWAVHGTRDAQDALYLGKDSYPELTDDEILSVWFDHYEQSGLEQENEDLKLSLRAKIRVLEGLPYTQAYTGELGNLVQKSYVEYGIILELMNSLKKDLKRISR